LSEHRIPQDAPDCDPLTENRLLAAVGLTGAEEAAYVLLIGEPRLTAADLADKLGLTSRRAQALLTELAAHGLVSRSLANPPEYLAAPPDVVVPALVLRRQEELQRARLAAVALAERARRVAARDELGPHVLELLSASKATEQRFEQLQQAAEHEVCALDRPPYPAQDGPPENLAELASLSRGVAYRAVYDPQALNAPGQPDLVRRFMAAGEQARVFPELPTRMIVIDGRAALIPLDAHHPGGESLLVRAPAVVDTLQMFFETLWDQAIPLPTTLTDSAEIPWRGPAGLGCDDAMVALLTAGLKDEAIARRMGISTRTLDRRIQILMRGLAARTRFQAGWQAARHYRPH
jgi:sugar-specific transcriptional regulator TrmB